MHIVQKKRAKKSFFKDNELQSFSFFALYTRNEVEFACPIRQKKGRNHWLLVLGGSIMNLIANDAIGDATES